MREFGTGNLASAHWQLQLRDSAGLAPDFP